MKRKSWICMLMATVSILFLESCNGKRMSDQPADTNKMEMTSTAMSKKSMPGNHINVGSLLRPANEFVVASLPVTIPQESDINIPVNAYGAIEADTRASGTISAKVSGRIEKLYLRYRFQNVAAGQKVLELYSPEIVTAQENLLFILKQDAQNTSFLNAAKEKLLLLGMSAAELNKVIQTGKVLYNISVYSNYNGHVMDNGMNQNGGSSPAPVTQALSLKEGMYVTKGEPLFVIMNHHKTWAALQIFPDDQALIKKGDAVKIVPDMDTAAVIDGKIDFIEPFFREGNKTLTARVFFNNNDMIAIGSQVKAKIFTGTKKGIWLPQTSVITLGINDVAFLKSDEGFTAHKIATGLRVGDKVQIISGLNSTDTVAANAQYLMDSESFIKPVTK